MKRQKNILSIIAVVLFLGYYASSTMFNHTHEFERGSVTHSHPYVPQGSHSHSAAACTAIEQLSLTFFALTTIALVVALFALTYHYGSLKVRDVQVRMILCRGLRAPPVC